MPPKEVEKDVKEIKNPYTLTPSTEDYLKLNMEKQVMNTGNVPDSISVINDLLILYCLH